MTTAIFSARRFRAWLAAKPADTIVGYALQCRTCPLAQFLAESGAPDPAVYLTGFTAHAGVRPVRRLPLWARRTLGLIDHRFRWEIRAGELREVLG